MYCGRQNMGPLAMATARICPAHSYMSTKIRLWISRR